MEDLELPGAQSELLDALLDTGARVVIVVVSGRPYALGRYAPRAAAIVQAFFPGQEGAGAVAGVLSGRIVPSGRLPVEIPARPGGQPATYLHPLLGGNSGGVSATDPTSLYPFGHGLSYTRFTYDGLTLSREEVPTDGELEVSCTIANAGERRGTETVQLYLGDPVAEVTRPLLQLAGFHRVELDPGEHAEVSFRLHADRTAFTGLDLQRIVEPGAIEVMVGPSSRDLPLRATFTLTGERRVVGPRSGAVDAVRATRAAAPRAWRSLGPADGRPRTDRHARRSRPWPRPRASPCPPCRRSPTAARASRRRRGSACSGCSPSTPGRLPARGARPPARRSSSCSTG